MGIKLEDKHVKSKLRHTFGNFEVYNVVDKALYNKISQMVKDNSKEVQIKDGVNDIEINNLVEVMREMLINLTNIESEEYWKGLGHDELEHMLDFPDGEFKDVVDDLTDVLFEFAHDTHKQGVKKMKVIENKIDEFIEAIKFNSNINTKLAELGLDMNKLEKIQNGDKVALEEFQKDFIANLTSKPKVRRKTKKK
jgi:hypothetical protein